MFVYIASADGMFLSARGLLNNFPFRNASISYVIRKHFFHMMKLNENQMSRVLRPGVLQLAELFTSHDYEMRIAGGAVRDLLMGKTPHDLDFATTATPQEMKTLFENEGVRMVNAGGEKHGTVTARIEEENFECTTLRIDVVTDGRHAEVEFTKDWQQDANRRDLTINAMFLALDGTVYDFFNGYQHLQEKYVTFVGDADTRIQEDYLRILRYFRFYGRIAESANGHDKSILESIHRNAKGLERVAGERIWVELQKIIVGRFGGDLLVTMVEYGVGPYVGFPENFNSENVNRVYDDVEASKKGDHECAPMMLLASGFNNEEEAFAFISRVKCSKKERELLLLIIQFRDLAINAKTFKPIQDLVIDLIVGEKRNKELALYYIKQLLMYAAQTSLLEELEDWEIPRFPVTGGQIIERKLPKMKTKFIMRDLLEEWKKSDFTKTSEELLDSIDVEKYKT